MPRFAANLTMMFNEVPFLDRFDRAAAAGFTSVEFLFPYDHPVEAVAERLNRNALTQALFNLPPGNWGAGERGIACHKDRFAEVLRGVDTALPYAKATGVKRVHLMSGLGDRRDRVQAAAYGDAVRAVAERVGAEGLELMLEPINGRDMPGYFLNDFRYAIDLIGDLGLPNVKLQFDIYHRQIMHGDVTMALRDLIRVIGHIQIASVPARNEPADGELDYGFLFAELDRLGYDGFVGCEYRPAGITEDGLGWFAPYVGKR
jgi:2-dehydrotetronate isomerase